MAVFECFRFKRITREGERLPMRKLWRLPAEKGCLSSTFSISAHVSDLCPFFFISIASHITH